MITSVIYMHFLIEDGIVFLLIDDIKQGIDLGELFKNRGHQLVNLLFFRISEDNANHQLTSRGIPNNQIAKRSLMLLQIGKADVNIGCKITHNNTDGISRVST